MCCLKRTHIYLGTKCWVRVIDYQRENAVCVIDCVHMPRALRLCFINVFIVYLGIVRFFYMFQLFKVYLIWLARTLWKITVTCCVCRVKLSWTIKRTISMQSNAIQLSERVIALFQQQQNGSPCVHTTKRESFAKYG